MATLQEWKEWLSLPLTQEALQILEQKVPELEHGLRAIQNWETYITRDAEITAYEEVLRSLRELGEKKE